MSFSTSERPLRKSRCQSGIYARGMAAGLLMVLLVLGFLSKPVLQAAPPEKNRLVLNAKGVTLPFYHGPENRLSLLVKADHFTRENQRKGFFRIGVLPLVVVHDVKLEARQPEHFGAVVREFHQYLAGKDLKKGVELRGFTLSVPTNKVSLTATKVRILSPQQWELSGAVQLITATSTNVFSRGMFTIMGENTGKLDAETKTFNVLSP